MGCDHFGDSTTFSLWLAFNCQLDTIWNHQGTLKEGMSTSVWPMDISMEEIILIKLLEVGKSTHYGWHHPLGLRSCTIKSEKSELNASKHVFTLCS